MMHEDNFIVTDPLGYLYAACQCGSNYNQGCRLDALTEVTLLVAWHSTPGNPTEITFDDPIKLLNLSSELSEDLYNSGLGTPTAVDPDYPEHNQLVQIISQKGDIKSCGLMQHGVWHEMPPLH